MKKEERISIKSKYVSNNLEMYNQNKDLILLYNQYIEKIVELFDFIRNNNSDLFYTIVFDILMEMGFFSFNHNFNNNVEDFKELSIKPGISIISGQGVCRNIASFYEDIFSYFYNYPLKMCCYDEKSNNSNDAQTYGNHVINLTKHNEIIYGFDITNHCIFKSINNDSFKGLDIDYYLKYMPNGDFLLNLLTILDIKKDLYSDIVIKKNIIKLAAKQNSISLEEYKNIIHNANEFIIERKKIFQSFLLKNNDLTYEIKQKMLLLK